MNKKEAIKYIENCLNKNSYEHLILILGNDKLENALNILLKEVKKSDK